MNKNYFSQKSFLNPLCPIANFLKNIFYGHSGKKIK